MVLTAALDALLARYSGQEDIAVGTTALGRGRPELERLIGVFVNMVVLRTDLSGDPRFDELLERVREVTLEAYDHQDVPFERVVERVAPVRDPSRNPLFQVGLQLLDQATGGGALSLPDVQVDTLTPHVQRSRFDLSLSFTDTPDGLTVAAEYSTELFDRARVQRLLAHLQRLLTAVLADPSLRLSALPLLEDADAVTVLRVNPARDPAGAGEVPSADIAHHLARHGVKAEAAHTVAEDIGVGDALLSRAADLGSDLIVMGGYGRSRLREIVLGGATRTVLRHMTVPVLMSH
jgi:non-ribosomal peptide synthetase component F